VPPVVNGVAASRQYDLDSLVARAYAQRADIDADEARVGAAEQDVKAAQASKWPTISLSLGYNTAYSSASELSVADQLNQRRGGSVGIGVSIPLFDRGSTDLATQRAQIQADNARLALQQQRQQVALDVRRAYLDHRAAQERLAAAQAQQRAADQALAATRERYRVGAATLVELTQSQAAQVQAASALVNARYSLVFQQSLMSYYTGELDPANVRLGD
jgi:outer membrane protein